LAFSIDVSVVIGWTFGWGLVDEFTFSFFVSSESNETVQTLVVSVTVETVFFIVGATDWIRVQLANTTVRRKANGTASTEIFIVTNLTVCSTTSTDSLNSWVC
jgi:hypothetical protein